MLATHTKNATPSILLPYPRATQGGGVDDDGAAGAPYSPAPTSPIQHREPTRTQSPHPAHTSPETYPLLPIPARRHGGAARTWHAFARLSW